MLHRALPGGGPMKEELVQDWMTREVITIAPETSLAEAHKLMTEKRIRRLPVMDRDRIVGIITLGDVRGAEPSRATSLSVWEMNYILAKLKAGEVMTREPVTIQQTASIGEAARIMLDKKFSGLPVVDEQGHLAGIITESDIFRLVAQEWSRG
jgi:CBS domain-containing protein